MKASDSKIMIWVNVKLGIKTWFNLIGLLLIIAGSIGLTAWLIKLAS